MLCGEMRQYGFEKVGQQHGRRNCVIHPLLFKKGRQREALPPKPFYPPVYKYISKYPRAKAATFFTLPGA